MDGLSVFLGGRFCGEVRRDRRGRATLSYAADYASGDNPPLSVSLPLSRRRHSASTVEAWLDGLLPDNPTTREQWAAREGVADASSVALLGTKIGRDCAGAAQFCRLGDEEMLLSQEGGASTLSDSQIADEVLRVRSEHMQIQTRERDVLYYSLGGFQPKFALSLTDNGWCRPTGVVPTTHIFKPSPPRLPPEFAVVEHLIMRTAQECGLAAADTALADYADLPTVIVERYDRAKRGETWERVHQEDMCQALGLHPARKYERHGGPGVSRIRDLLESVCEAPRQAVEQFGDALLFNWMVSNSDAHAKNYSLLLSHGPMRLAPLYDLQSFVGADERLAMRFSGSGWRVADHDTPEALKTLPALLVLPSSRVLDRASAIAAMLPCAYDRAVASLPEHHQGSRIVHATGQSLWSRAQTCLAVVEQRRSDMQNIRIQSSAALVDTHRGTASKAVHRRCEHVGTRSNKRCRLPESHRGQHRY